MLLLLRRRRPQHRVAGTWSLSLYGIWRAPCFFFVVHRHRFAGTWSLSLYVVWRARAPHPSNMGLGGGSVSTTPCRGRGGGTLLASNSVVLGSPSARRVIYKARLIHSSRVRPTRDRLAGRARREGPPSPGGTFAFFSIRRRRRVDWPVWLTATPFFFLGFSTNGRRVRRLTD